MIPESAIIEWSNSVPWKSNAQIEQDLVICRALVELFNDNYIASHLAFRGGTALYKLFIAPQPRYSEDIDLVQINAESIKNTIIRIKEVLFWLGKPAIKQKANNNTLVFRFESEMQPVLPLRLKIEINCREHFNVLGLNYQEFSVHSRWFSGSCKITTYQIEEMLGTKLRALYQRRKGRDLFDLYKALTSTKIDTEKIIECYHRYIGFVVEKPPTKKEFLINMDAKITSEEFLGDTNLLLRHDEVYQPQIAYEIVRTQLIEKL